MKIFNHISKKLSSHSEDTQAIEKNNSVYFLGIGGIGMSALARYYKHLGYSVSGYDKTETPLTLRLKDEGMTIHFSDDITLADTKADIVIYTPAIPKNHSELVYFQKNNYNLLKRSQVLGMITEENFNICIAGTHGKTTTSAMVAHLLTKTGFGCNAFLGGIATNYDTNFLSSVEKVAVIEADEYDRSFLQLSPDIAIITAMDADHLDIYGTEENMQNSFIDFSKRIKANGLLLLKKGIKRETEFIANTILTYHISDEKSDVHTRDLKIVDGGYQFDVVLPKKIIEGVKLNMGGAHNIENVLAAVAVASHLNIDEAKIKEAVADFRGVKRRFEYVLKTEALVLIDDYAHHPQELEALIDGAQKLFPERKCMVIFQPHLFSRTKDLAREFAAALSQADEVILLPIYPAREEPIEGVSSGIIEKEMSNKVQLFSKQDLLNFVQNNLEVNKEKMVLIIAGAGDIDNIVLPIKQILEAKISAEIN